MSLNSNKNRNGRSRDVNHRITVQASGQLVIGATHTKQMGLEPGDEFEINLGYKYIHLKQVSDKPRKYQEECDRDE